MTVTTKDPRRKRRDIEVVREERMEYILNIRSVEDQEQNTLTSLLYIGDILFTFTFPS
jgi:hypothetical protein